MSTPFVVIAQIVQIVDVSPGSETPLDLLFSENYGKCSVVYVGVIPTTSQKAQLQEYSIKFKVTCRALGLVMDVACVAFATLPYLSGEGNRLPSRLGFFTLFTLHMPVSSFMSCDSPFLSSRMVDFPTGLVDIVGMYKSTWCEPYRSIDRVDGFTHEATSSQLVHLFSLSSPWTPSPGAHCVLQCRRYL